MCRCTAHVLPTHKHVLPTHKHVLLYRSQPTRQYALGQQRAATAAAEDAGERAWAAAAAANAVLHDHTAAASTHALQQQEAAAAQLQQQQVELESLRQEVGSLRRAVADREQEVQSLTAALQRAGEAELQATRR